MSKRVLIVGGADYAMAKMFIANGWSTTINELDTDVDLVQFTGGADVDPSYYQEQKHAATWSNPSRDAREAGIFQEFKGKVPMAGICRGGQFLNVMNGGKMWQHVNNHATSKLHEAFDHINNKTLFVTSTHHQMIIPTESAILCMTANEATVKQGYDKEEVGHVNPDIESVYYPETNSLCYQPHPEYLDANHPCQKTYFDYLSLFMGL